MTVITGESILWLFTMMERRHALLTPGDRIAQLVVMPYLAVEFNEVSELSDTKRGAGGFGSTGAN